MNVLKVVVVITVVFLATVALVHATSLTKLGEGLMPLDECTATRACPPPVPIGDPRRGPPPTLEEHDISSGTPRTAQLAVEVGPGPLFDDHDIVLHTAADVPTAEAQVATWLAINHPTWKVLSPWLGSNGLTAYR